MTPLVLVVESKTKRIKDDTNGVHKSEKLAERLVNDVTTTVMTVVMTTVAVVVMPGRLC